MRQIPRVGVGILVSKDDEILMLHRVNPHGRGTWSAPGGHMEHGETPEEAAIREVKEETGLSVTDVEVIGITADFFEENGRHYITIWMEGKWLSGEPVVKSPTEISAATWFPYNALPKPLFLTFQNLVAGKPYLLQTPAERRSMLSLIRSNFRV